jgi:chromosome segregation ATPase
MIYEKTNYKLGENIYKSIEIITNSTKETISISTNLLSQLSNLFDSIEDDITSEIISEAGKLNDFISIVTTFTKNELQEIKIKTKIAIEKAEKRKRKILKLKEENNKLNEKIEEDKIEKEQLILNIDNISKQLSDLYQENNMLKHKSNLEIMNCKNEKIQKEKYLNQLNNMQNDLDLLKEKNKNFQNNMNKFQRMSVILKEKNKKLNSELGAQTIQFINKIKEHNDQKNLINSLRVQNDELSKKIKYYETQIEVWQIKCKNLEDKNNDLISKTFYSKISEKNINTSNKKILRKSSKKISQIRKNKKIEFTESDDDKDNENLRYKTFSNLNDLLGNVSDKSMRKNSSNKSQINKIDIIYSFDLDYFFEIKLCIYENFFI